MQSTKTFLIGADRENNHRTYYTDQIKAFGKFTIKINYERSGAYPKVYNNQFMYDGVVELKKRIRK